MGGGGLEPEGKEKAAAGGGKAGRWLVGAAEGTVVGGRGKGSERAFSFPFGDRFGLTQPTAPSTTHHTDRTTVRGGIKL